MHKSLRPPRDLQQLQRLIHQVAHTQPSLLSPLHPPPPVALGILVLVEDGGGPQEVVIVGDQRRANPAGVCQDEVLQDLEAGGKEDGMRCVKGAFEGGNEEGHAGKELVRTGFHEVHQTLHGQEAIGLPRLSEAFKEEGHDGAVIQVGGRGMPMELWVLRTAAALRVGLAAVLDGGRERAAVVRLVKRVGTGVAAAVRVDSRGLLLLLCCGGGGGGGHVRGLVQAKATASLGETSRKGALVVVRMRWWRW